MIEEFRLSTAIMTHPARLDRAEALAASVADLDPVIIVDCEDSQPGNLGNSLRAWSAIASEATHHLVLQDDVVPCQGFKSLVQSAVTRQPSAAISLFCEWGSRSAGLVRVAARRGWGWARAVDMYTPSQGLVLPREVALGFASLRDTGGADDLALVDYLRGTETPSLVTVPNLLDHDDHLSLTGNGFQGPRRAVCLPGAGNQMNFDSPVAGEGLTRVPYASWMRTHAEWFYCGIHPKAYTWLGDFADVQLPEGLRKTDLVAHFRADLDRVTVPPLHAQISELALFEYWTVYFALGLTQVEPLPATPGEHSKQAFATAFPGLFRRHLPSKVLEAASTQAGELAHAAFERGAYMDLQRPHAEWFREVES